MIKRLLIALFLFATLAQAQFIGNYTATHVVGGVLPVGCNAGPPPQVWVVPGPPPVFYICGPAGTWNPFVSGPLGGFTIGSVPFGVGGGGLGQDNANLFWDNTTNRLGIGTALPIAPLHIEGAAGVNAWTVMHSVPGFYAMLRLASGVLGGAPPYNSWDIRLSDTLLGGYWGAGDLSFGEGGGVSQLLIQAATGNTSIGGPGTAPEKLRVYNGNSRIDYGHLKFISEATPGPPTLALGAATGLTTAGAHSCKVTFVTANGETEAGAASNVVTVSAHPNEELLELTAIPTGTTGVTTGRNIYCNKNGGTTWYLVAASPTIPNNTAVVYTVNYEDAVFTATTAPAADTTTGGIGVDGTQRIVIDPVTGNVTIGTTPGGGTYKLSVAGNIGISGSVDLVNLYGYGKILLYGGISTVDNGVPAEYAVYNSATLTAALGATTLYAVPATGAGTYRISWLAKIITPATTSSVLGGTNGFQITYTSNDDSVVLTPLAIPNAVATGNTTGTQLSGVVIANCKASTNLQIQFDWTSVGATPMGYKLHAVAEKM